MEIKRLGDLIVDDYGNYYHVIEKKGNSLTLANAFMELSFRRKLDELYMEEHAEEYVGTHAMDILKSVIERIEAGKTNLKMIRLHELEEEYDVVIEPLYERK
ncbi:MAG TPA: hypothetical protein VFK33_09255 [Bacillales bacterium]|nr:hypothetical protein [Bacillales bacterium]